MVTALPIEFLDVIANNNGLKVYLSSLSKGRPFTPRSWLYEEIEPDKVLSMWLDRLEVLKNGDSTDQRVYQFDVSQLAKWGPQGGIAPIQDLLPEIVEPTFSRAGSPRPSGLTSKEWSAAVERVNEYYAQKRLRGIVPLAYESVVADMRARDTLFSNSGWPMFSRRNKPDVLEAAVAAARGGEWIDFPAIALFRNYNLKTRLVWMFPEATNIVEGSFCQPIQSAMVSLKLPFYSPWVGFDAVRRLVTEAYGKGLYLAASDFSKTDEHFGPATIMATFDVLKNCLKRDAVTGLRRSLERMYSIPLIIGPSEMLTGKHGVASGSMWTNFIETVFDDVFQTYVSQHQKHMHGLCAIGDDMCWWSNQYDDQIPKVLEQLAESVGQTTNAEKVTNERDTVKFLQRLFIRGYSRPDGLLRGVYSTVRALKSSVYPERFHKPADWSGDMFCARQFMILENCVDHPLFEEFVKFVCKGDYRLIPFAKKSAAELGKITRGTKIIPGFNPTYNQEKRDTSLAAFASIKIAREL